jgi:NADPH-dependent 2,4-dienoyl-CoA reductase/sulfur reductase-like enzyme
VTHVVVENEDKSTIKVPCSLVVVGIGARPNVELFASQLETADPPVGGIKVCEHPSHLLV